MNLYQSPKGYHGTQWTLTQGLWGPGQRDGLKFVLPEVTPIHLKLAPQCPDLSSPLSRGCPQGVPTGVSEYELAPSLSAISMAFPADPLHFQHGGSDGRSAHLCALRMLWVLVPLPSPCPLC